MIDPLRIKALYEEGYGTRLIAEKLGRSRRTIRDHLARMRLPMRTAAEGQALYHARLIILTKEERRIAQLQTYKKYDRLRRKVGKGLDHHQRKFIRTMLRRMK